MKEKKVVFDPRAFKDFSKLSTNQQDAFYQCIDILEVKGELKFPLGRRILGFYNLFEMRIRAEGTWRGLYSYLPDNSIVILSIFNKKRQKTPRNEINTAIKRLKNH